MGNYWSGMLSQRMRRRKAMVLAPLYGPPHVHRQRFRAVAPEVVDE